MPFQRPQVAEKQRADRLDFNRLSSDGFASLLLAMGELAGGTGVVRGLRLTPTAPPGMAVTLETGSAFDPTGLLLVLESTTILNVVPAHPTLPRIDLVSLAGAEGDADVEERLFINDGVIPATTNAANTPTRKRVVVTPAITTGTPAGSPVAPATPAGHRALHHVRVEAGATAIDASKLSRVGAPPIDLADRLKAVSFSGAGVGVQILPWLSNSIGGQLTVPAASMTVVMASILVQANLGLPSLDFAITSLDGITIARRRAAILSKYGASAIGEESVSLIGFRGPTTKESTYLISIANTVPPGHAGIVVPSVFSGEAVGHLSNFIAAVSI